MEGWILIGIVCALDSELKPFLDMLASYEKVEYMRWIFYIADFNEKKLVFLKTGVGKVNAAIGVSLLKERFSVDMIINAGISGIINRELEIGDIVIAETLMYHDCYNTGPATAADDLHINISQCFYGDKPAVELLESLLQANMCILEQNAMKQRLKRLPRIKIGKMISGDIPVFESKLAERLWTEYQADCVDMESASIAHACKMLDIPFLAARIMSDNANEKSLLSILKYEGRLNYCLAAAIMLFLKDAVLHGEAKA